MYRNISGFVLVLGIFCLMIFSPSLLSESVAAEEKGEKQGTDNKVEPESKETFHLHYQFTPGEFVHYKVSDGSTYTTQKDTFKETAKNQAIAWRQYRVVSVDSAGEAVLELMIDRVWLLAQFDNSPPIVFDSADPKLRPDRFKHILKTVGKPMSRMRVKQTGEMVSIQNLFGPAAKVVKKVKAKDPDNSEQDPSKKKKEIEVDQTPNFLVVFPEEAISIGDTWKQTLEVEVPVSKTLKEKVKLLRIYTLKSVEDEKATISLSTVLITPVRDPGVKVRLLQQTPSGTIVFDIKRHLLLSRDLKTDDRVLGAFGAGTQVNAASIRSEKLQPDSTAKAEQEADTKIR